MTNINCIHVEIENIWNLGYASLLFPASSLETSRLKYMKHRLRVFENRLLGRPFGPKREEVVGSWRRLHNEELYKLYT
jgi:hypothetical protein